MATGQLARATLQMRPPTSGDIIFINLSDGSSLSITATASETPSIGEFYDGIRTSLTTNQVARSMADSLIQLASLNNSFGAIIVSGVEGTGGAISGESESVVLEVTSLDPNILSVTIDAELVGGTIFESTSSSIEQDTLGIDTSKKMFVRSPFFLDVSSSSGDQITSARVDIYVYEGNRFFDRPDEPSYRISSAALTSGSTSASFNISEYARDYFIDAYSFNSSTGVISSKNYYVDVVPSVTTSEGVQSSIPTYLIAHYGYGFVEDGMNPQPVRSAAISNQYIYRLTGSTMYLPIVPMDISNVTQRLPNGQSSAPVWLKSQEYTEGTSSEEITYLEIVPETTQVTILLDSFGFEQYYIVDVDECKYNPIEVFFVNRFGAVQNLWFFKNSTEKLEVKGEQFRRNTITNSSYSTADHQYKTLFKGGKRSITLNSGFYPESHNEVFEQLLLSEDCWMSKDGVITAINIKSSNMKFKTSVTEKLISYSIDAEIAFDRIQNIT